MPLSREFTMTVCSMSTGIYLNVRRTLPFGFPPLNPPNGELTRGVMSHEAQLARCCLLLLASMLAASLLM
jgi:hypothetical protein